MSKVIRYSVTFLGTIEIFGGENLTDNQIKDLIAEDLAQWGDDINFANDVEYDIEEE